MKNEKLKSVILLLLIISSIVMSAFVWLSEELWPTGYNFFINLKNNVIIRSILRQEEPYSIPKENLSRPQRMVVTNGSKRAVYYNSDASFDRLFEVSKNFMSQTLNTNGAVIRKMTVGEDEWYNVLGNDEFLDTRYMYIDYPLAFTPRLFAQVLGIKTTWMEQDISAVKDFIIAPLGESGSEMLLYVRDFRASQIYKYYIDYSEKNEFYKAIIEYTRGETDNYLFSFELKLHASDDDHGTGVVQTVFIEPLVIISPKEGSRAPIIESSNPLNGQPGFNKDDLISTFNHSAHSASHYTDPGGVEHFIENYSSLKLHQNGLIEYAAVDDKKGISLIEDDKATLYESLNSAIEFSEKVWRCVMPFSPFNVLVTSNLLENTEKPGTYRFTLDYYFEGTPVTVNLEGEGSMKNAVVIEMTQGRITKYRHLLSRFEKTESVANSPSMISVLDGIRKKFSVYEDETRIKDIFLSYIETGSTGPKSPVWCARSSGSNDLIIYGDGDE